MQASAAAVGFRGDLTPGHPRHKTVFGTPAVPSLRDLPKPADLAFIMVPTDAVEEDTDDAAAAEVRGAIVLASGYRETGAEGRALEDRLVSRAVANGITLLGPNCLGFLNAHAKAGPYALTVPLPLEAGPVGIAMQSGALASVMLSFARSRAIGVSTVASLGNEAMITASDVINHLIDDEDTRVICLFLEQIGDPAAFAAAAARPTARASRSSRSRPAKRRGQPGRAGPHGLDRGRRRRGRRRAPPAQRDPRHQHRGAPDYRSAARVRAPASGRRMGVRTASGGACDIIADRAAEQGIEIPGIRGVDRRRDRAARAAVRPGPQPPGRNRLLPGQPADVGADRDRPRAGRRSRRRWPGLRVLLRADAARRQAPYDAIANMLDERVAWLGRRMASSPVPVISVGSTCVDVTPFGRDLLGRNGIHLLGGMDLGVQAIGNAIRWAEGHGRSWPGPPTAAASPAAGGGSPTPKGHGGKLDARELLASFGVPLGAGRDGQLGRRGRRRGEEVRLPGRAADQLRGDRPQVRHRRGGPGPAHHYAATGRIQEGASSGTGR